MRQISASVGLHGVNRKDDVRAIQELLNLVPHADGGPLAPLKVDGLCGYKTNGAIEKLQARKWGWSHVSTKVAPASATWLLLLSYDQPAAPPAVPAAAVASPPLPPAPDPPKQVSTSFAIFIAASPGQPLREPNFYFLITDMTDQSQKALYYFGNITPPPLPQPLKWSVTIPMIVKTLQPLGAADWSGEAEATATIGCRSAPEGWQSGRMRWS